MKFLKSLFLINFLVTTIVCGLVFSRPVDEEAIIPYNYGYEIHDPETNNYQNKAEVKTEDGDVFGSYSVLMPDGFIYTTTYNVTKNSGYRAVMRKTLPSAT